jgi:Calcineurin-like phosphoesterase
MSAASGVPRPPIPDHGEIGRYRELPTGSPNSWLRPSVLWRSRNDIVSRIHDPVDALREAWLGLQGLPSGTERVAALRITGHERRERTAFMVVGDTGEGDGSQMAVVPGLELISKDSDFTVVCSDVIYPAGDTDDYRAKFYLPYQAIPGPIYAIPGNHDWYDRLVGFMTHFCDATAAPPAGTGRGPGLRGRLASWLWRDERQIQQPTVQAGEQQRPRNPAFPSQRGPYWSLDAGDYRLVGIDTGIAGDLDAAQGEWLLRVSQERPEAAKILLTGKPLIVDGKYHAGEIAGSQLTVDRIVRKPEHGYVAAIGGDIHNYQRYPITLADGRTLQYVVSGGGGAFMHSTHKIPRIDGAEGVAARLRAEMNEELALTEFETHFFPARAWSLYWCSRLLGPRNRQLLGLSHAEAGAVLGEALDVEALDADARALLAQYHAHGMPKRVRLVKTLLYDRLPAPGKLFQRFLSEIVDNDDPPMAKSYLRCDASPEALRVRCFRATGWRADELEPTLEDEVSIARGV